MFKSHKEMIKKSKKETLDNVHKVIEGGEMTINASKNRLLLLHKQSFHEESEEKDKDKDKDFIPQKKAKKCCKYIQ